MWPTVRNEYVIGVVKAIKNSPLQILNYIMVYILAAAVFACKCTSVSPKKRLFQYIFIVDIRSYIISTFPQSTISSIMKFPYLDMASQQTPQIINTLPLCKEVDWSWLYGVC